MDEAQSISLRPITFSACVQATGKIKDIRQRFSHALRINPHTPLNLYLQLNPGKKVAGRVKLAASQITVYEDNRYLDNINIIELKEGQLVPPLDVVVSANDEPDHGLDIGLYTDSKTAHGKVYGFGQQPFGNPNLEYGTQAPFHMGFYHESNIMYAAGRFLKRTYPEYRIQQFKHLSQFAFAHGHPYWGWRFMGLGLHYVGDFSNPYHVTPMPGNSTVSTIWVGLLNMLGITGPQTNAVQIVSNRHTAIEKFQELVMKKAYSRGDLQHATLQATHRSESIGQYQDAFVVEVYAKGAYEHADKLDDAILKNMPKKFVADNSIEFSELSERHMLLQKIREHKGQAGINELEKILVQLLKLFSENGKSYVQGILQH